MSVTFQVSAHMPMRFRFFFCGGGTFVVCGAGVDVRGVDNNIIINTIRILQSV